MKKYNIANYVRYKEDVKAMKPKGDVWDYFNSCLLYTSPSPRDGLLSRMPSSA